MTLNNHFDELKGPRLRQVEKEMNKISNLELDNTNQSDKNYITNTLISL